MNKSLIRGIGVAVVSLWSALAQQFAAAPPPMITVSGSAEVKVRPDEVILRIGVESRNVNLMEAKSQNDAAVAKTLAFLRKEIDSKNIQTDLFSFEPVYEREHDRIKPTAYWARNSIEVKITDIKKLDGIISGVMATGVNTIHGVEFRTSELRKHRDTARALAVKAAIEKADAAAKELNVGRGKIYNLTVNENGWGYGGGWWGSRYSSSNLSQNAMQVAPGGGVGDDSESALSAGQISISASVTASFLVN
jgi:uncharacterized protein